MIIIHILIDFYLFKSTYHNICHVCDIFRGVEILWQGRFFIQRIIKIVRTITFWIIGCSINYMLLRLNILCLIGLTFFFVFVLFFIYSGFKNAKLQILVGEMY